MPKVRAGWTPSMEQRADLDGWQVKCLIASEGHRWMRDYFDCLPSPVRRRLADSPHNICPACMSEEAARVAAGQRLKRPTISVYFAVIDAIERKLTRDDGKPNERRA
jgi:hypothetical protein